MQFSTKIAAFAAALAVMPVAAFAQDNPLPGTFTGNVALVSDYMYRGVSQTDNNAAVQGGLDWDTGYGFHFGTWASTVNFNDGNAATTEIDLYAGYGGKIDNFSYDVGVMYYWYPGAPSVRQYDMWEVYGKAGYDFGLASVNAGIAFSPDNFGSTGDATYLNAGVVVPLVDLLSVSANVGHGILTQGLKNTTDWNAGATLKVYDWFDVDARYYDSDIHALGRLADDKFVVKISRTF